ncbi:hypothetical protein [Streptomyces sp. B93]|uniref:hypothetical protein n=1 Tax=Streptomyces sp. B93 TaxID=2824875 RepID=UPI001B3813E7|nr:hypothetical protein [Streptomyces sp. B93]MBQ1091679.1 hypothetical protein [Streptomyces sp. B93]
MSRETDSPSSGPNGRGGAAYPSGTPPYGTPTGGNADAGRTAAQPEDRKTETTLTTRIRINIPGSRPIPPVVVRKPVGETEDTGATEGGTPTPSGGVPAAALGGAERSVEPAGAAASGGTGAMGAAGGSGGPGGAGGPGGGEKTSDWFAPRKSQAPKAGQGGSTANGASASGASPAPGTPGAGAGVPAGPRPGAGRPGGSGGSMNMQGGGTNGAGLPGATGGPVAPGHGGGTGSFDVTEALTAGQRGPEPRRDDLPYFSDDDPSSQTGQHAQDPYGGFGGPGAAQHPSGPTGGPVTGDGPRLPAVGGPGAAPGRPGGPAGPNAPGGPGTAGGGPRTAPGAPGHGPGGGLSDDTAILTPQKPAPEPPGGLYGNTADNVSGHTVTSGIPVVPPADRGTPPFGTPAHADAPRPQQQPKPPAPAAAAPRKKKGRNKLVLLGGGLIAVAGVAYGAGLLMNHSDVPKGTTVLGVDIGGGTRDEAVKKLGDALGDRINSPLKLSVDGEAVALKPDQAGLQFDATATVAAAAESDYNPVSVIGSLFGNQRVVEPVMPVDEEKLNAALERAAGGAGSVTEGTIRFESGKAVPVYGKAGKGIAVGPAASAVEAAYRTQVETGTAATVQVPTTAKQPTVDKAEVDRMMKEFAEPAMSDNVTVQTDPAHSIAFSPENSLWKFLGVKAVDGKLVESYDKAALQELYGSTFDDVRITRATGQKTAVTVEDVIGALRLALKSTTDRTAVIETDPN